MHMKTTVPICPRWVGFPFALAPSSTLPCSDLGAQRAENPLPSLITRLVATKTVAPCPMKRRFGPWVLS